MRRRSPADATVAARPPVVWLKGEGNFTKSHRGVESIDKVVVHVTEGAFWGSVRWLQNPRAHASSHFVVGRRGKIVQLVHLSDIAWHAGNWKVNTQSVGIEHEGFTYGPGGFTNAQYHASARLAAWIARRSLMPINRRHFIGHANVPAPGGGRGGASHHTDPGPRWKWDYYLRLVRRYAGVQKLSVVPVVPAGRLRGIVPWRAKATGDIRRVEFAVDGRVLRVDRQPPFTYAGRLNTAKLGTAATCCRCTASPDPGATTSPGGRSSSTTRRSRSRAPARARGRGRAAPVRLRVRPWGAKATRVVLQGRRATAAPSTRGRRSSFAWNARRAQARQARARGRRDLGRRPRRAPAHPARRRRQAAGRSRSHEAEARAEAGARAQDRLAERRGRPGGDRARHLARRRRPGAATHVEFRVDGVLRGTDVAAPYTLGWNADAESPGPHRLTARAVGTNGKAVEAAVTVTVPAAPGSGTATP